MGMVAIIAAFLAIGVVVLFKLLPSSYFMLYEEVLVVDPSKPSFRSIITFYKNVDVTWNDLMFCNGTRIPLAEDRASYEPGVYDFPDKSWTALFNKEVYIGQACRVQWRAYPTLFGIIKGRPDTGFTEFFILK